jgi:hypothetical protein
VTNSKIVFSVNDHMHSVCIPPFQAVDVAADKTVEHEQEIMVDLQTHFVPQN